MGGGGGGGMGKVGVRMDFEGPDPKSEHTYTYTYTPSHSLKKEQKHASYAFSPPMAAHEIPQMHWMVQFIFENFVSFSFYPILI